ncbi:hypothetical protein AB0K92_25780 [Streptomyces sp. NPDC052687]|uniref:hypothetical protein n=1 Tax=Streptomyces sp. NPDC052687 TaxID=3154759 RepID=UPI00341CF5B6
MYGAVHDLGDVYDSTLACVPSLFERAAGEENPHTRPSIAGCLAALDGAAAAPLRDLAVTKVATRPGTRRGRAATAAMTCSATRSCCGCAARCGPVAARPGRLSPAQSGPAQSGPAQSGPAQSGPAQSGPAQSGPARTGPAQSGSARTGPATPP